MTTFTVMLNLFWNYICKLIHSSQYGEFHGDIKLQFHCKAKLKINIDYIKHSIVKQPNTRIKLSYINKNQKTLGS